MRSLVVVVVVVVQVWSALMIAPSHSASTNVVVLPRSCEPIRVEMCSHLGYNWTAMPNLGGNEVQAEAEYTLKSFAPLIQYGCSTHLTLLLCSVYVPMCNEKVETAIGPCRSLCVGVRSRCYPVLKDFGFAWPEALNCSRFPEHNDHRHMCMEGPKEVAGLDPSLFDHENDVDDDNGDNDDENEIDSHHQSLNHPCLIHNGMVELFEEPEKRFAEVWVTVWAFICLVMSLTTVLTLLIGGGRIRARPLLSLALCYCMVSTGWTLRMFSGRIVVPSSESTATTAAAAHLNCLNAGLLARRAGTEDTLRIDTNPTNTSDGLQNANCAFIFLLLYYFGMAAHAWWVSLCAWWVGRVGLSWSEDKMNTLGSILHVLAWGLPATQTVAALVRRDVDADYLTGTCYIGNRNSDTLVTLVLIPTAFYFISGLMLLVIGCACAVIRCRRRSTITAPALPLTASTPRKESDFLGAICTLYAVPTFCVLITIYYEYTQRHLWFTKGHRPALWAFLLRHLMSLFIGVSTVCWIWSMKTVVAWRAMCKRMVGEGGALHSSTLRKQPLPVKSQLPPTTTVLRFTPSQVLPTVAGPPPAHPPPVLSTTGTTTTTIATSSSAMPILVRHASLARSHHTHAARKIRASTGSRHVRATPETII